MSASFRPRIGVGPFRRALVLESPDPSLDGHLRELGIEPHRPAVTPTGDAELIALLQAAPYELIFKRSRVQITAAVLDAAPNLFAVVLCCIGDDSVDKRACAERGILVINDPVSNGRSVAELVIGEMILLCRRIFQAVDETRANTFNKSQESRFEVQGKTIGLLGLGNIGKQVAQLAQALGMKIVFYDNRDVAKEVGETMGWSFVPNITDLFAAADVVSAHISASDYRGRSNENLLQLEHFAAMAQKERPSPRLFINAARGQIHDADTLIEAVKRGYVGAAMVDVFPVEPSDAKDPWVNPYGGCPQIYATPHIGAATLEAQPRIATHVAASAHHLSTRGRLRNCVFGPKHVVGLDDADDVSHIMTVVHADTRGTKKAVDDAIYAAGAGNLLSQHRDFTEYGIAYEVVAIDHPLSPEQLEQLADEAAKLTGDPTAIRAIRQIRIGGA
jgi:D-3-phosphoglycerate dehydrogenase